jgi:hypothetical protein
MLFSDDERTLLSAGLLDLGGLAVTDESVVGLELLHGLGAVVNEGEAGALATTVLGAETEDGDLVLVGLVQLGELLAELILGDVRAVGVEDVTVQYIISPRCSISLAIPCARSVILIVGWRRRKAILHSRRGGGIVRTRPSACGPGGGCG